MEEILCVQNVEKYYGKKGNLTKALDNVSFSVNEGEFVGIMGASGSGKTTLLNCISTIDTVTSGHVLIRGRDVTEMKSRSLARFRREELGFLFQDYNLLDTLTGFENIILALTISGVNHKEAEKRVNQAAERLDITDVLPKYPYEMSGRERQRVAAARAIITNPALVLADEPTGALDSKSARLFLERLETLNRELNTTIGIYIGIVFLITSAAVLALQQLSEAADNRQRYAVLKKIGADDQLINRALFKQIAIYFTLPLALACVHSVVGIKVVNDVLCEYGSYNVTTNIIVTALLILLVYSAYFLATYLESKNIILKSER
ncbi:MAG: ATP-binding cassette domain-containing protein [Dethiobacteria bacterium]